MCDPDIPLIHPDQYPFKLRYIDSFSRYTYTQGKDKIDYTFRVVIFHHFGDSIAHFARSGTIKHTDENGREHKASVILLSHQPVVLEEKEEIIEHLCLGYNVIVPIINGETGEVQNEIHIQCNPDKAHLDTDPYLAHPHVGIDFGIPFYVHSGLDPDFFPSLYVQIELRKKVTKAERRAIRMEARIRHIQNERNTPSRAILREIIREIDRTCDTH